MYFYRIRVKKLKEVFKVSIANKVGGPSNGMFDGAMCADMQTANYMTSCCMEEDVITDVVTGIRDIIQLVMYHDVREVPCNGMYAGGVNTAYVENFLMAFCKAKREHFDRLQKELIPMDVIKLIVAKGAPRECRSELLSIIMSKSWDKLAKEFIIKVGDQEDFPQMLVASMRKM